MEGERNFVRSPFRTWEMKKYVGIADQFSRKEMSSARRRMVRNYPTLNWHLHVVLISMLVHKGVN